jgi:preprotein translocase subunit SecB
MSTPDPSAKQFGIQRVFLKDVSFESPAVPEIFRDQGLNPQIELSLRVEDRALGNDQHEVTLRATVTAKTGDTVVFVCEVVQAGLFLLRGFSSDETGQLLNVYAANTLFPFLRQAVSDLVVKGGFPQLLLAPLNFEELWQRKKAQVA